MDVALVVVLGVLLVTMLVLGVRSGSGHRLEGRPTDRGEPPLGG